MTSLIPRPPPFLPSICVDMQEYTEAEDHFCVLLWMQMEGENRGGLGTRISSVTMGQQWHTICWSLDYSGSTMWKHSLLSWLVISTPKEHNYAGFLHACTEQGKYSTNLKHSQNTSPLNTTITLCPRTGQFTLNDIGWCRNHMRSWSVVTGRCSRVWVLL